jgi:hypothetical protein
VTAKHGTRKAKISQLQCDHLHFLLLFWKVVTDDVVVDDVDVLLFKSQPRPRSLDHL